MTTNIFEEKTLSTATNSTVRELFKDNPDFESGEVIIGAIEDTSNPNVKSLILVQQRKDIKLTATSMNPLVQLTMGLKPIEGRTVRTWHNIDSEILASLKNVRPGVAALSVFKQLDPSIESLKIAVIERHTPRTWSNADGVEQIQSPVRTSKGRALTSEGKFVYQHTELCANNSMDDELLKIDRF